MRIDVAVNVAGQGDELLPENDPEAGEEHKEPHEATDPGKHQCEEPDPDPPGHTEAGIKPQCDTKYQRDQQHGQNQPVVADYYAEVSRNGGDRRWRRVSGLARLAKEKQNHKKKREDAERRNAINTLNTEVTMRPGREIGPCGAADVDHRVVNGIADGANVRLGGAGRGTDHARLHQRDTERREDEDEADKQTERHGVTHRRKPGRSDGTNQEIRGREDQIGYRKSASEAQAVG